MAETATGSNTSFRNHEISDSEFEHLRELIYREAGINLTSQKKFLAQTRLGKLMRRRKISGYDELFSMIKNDDSGLALEMVIDAISTNHTFFFREDAHFTLLNEELIPELLKRKKNQKQLVRIWSAGCSSGEEPFTAVITFLEAQRKRLIPGDIQLEVVGTDISNEILDKARAGLYPIESIENLEYELKKKYFQKGRGRYQKYVRLKPSVVENVNFRRHNLLFPFTEFGSFDIIFCRNVMIYFDQQTKQKVVENLVRSMHQDSFAIIGHSESLNNITHPLKSYRPTIFRPKEGF